MSLESEFYQKENNARTTITNNPLSSSGLSITVATGTGSKFPSEFFLVTIWDNVTYENDPTSDPNMELILCDDRSSDTIIVNASGRGFGGTTAVQHAAGSACALLIIKEHMEQYEEAIGDLENYVNTGWMPVTGAWTYSSVDNPTGVITVPSDATTDYSVGMRIRFVNSGNTIYGIITAVSATTLTFLHEINTATATQAKNLMANAAITSPYYSTQKTPFGFPTSEVSWTFETSSSSSLAQSSPATGTWYNLGSYSMSVPIGAWDVSYSLAMQTTRSSTTGQDFEAALSSSNGDVSGVYVDFITIASIVVGGNGGNPLTLAFQMSRSKNLTFSSKTSLFLLGRALSANSDAISFVGTAIKIITRARCTYL